MNAESTGVTAEQIYRMVKGISDLRRLYSRPPLIVMTEIDLFGDELPDEWILDVFKVCNRNLSRRFLFLTENRQRMRDFAAKNPFPENIIIFTKKDFNCIFCGSAYANHHSSGRR